MRESTPDPFDDAVSVTDIPIGSMEFPPCRCGNAICPDAPSAEEAPVPSSRLTEDVARANARGTEQRP